MDKNISWRAVAFVSISCIVISGAFGVTLALLLGGQGYTLNLSNWHLPAFAMPWLAPPTTQIIEIEPEPVVDDASLFDLSRKPESPVVSIAKSYLGIPYEYAGDYNPIDCSGLTVAVFRQLGLELPRTTYGQVELGAEIDTIEDMIPGDLIFFENTSNGFQTGVTHVGIYIGNREMIHASLRYGEVTITSVNDPFYVEHWHSMRRVLDDSPTP